MFTLAFSGRRLRQKREAADLRREFIAVAIDRSLGSIIAYESGTIDPPASVVGRLAAVLDCSPADFYERQVVAA
ncbi:MAG: helix-turn-helix transcriptional regulator [Acidimicrobiales bacterium]